MPFCCILHNYCCQQYFRNVQGLYKVLASYNVVAENSVLLFLDVSVEDSGNYTCHILGPLNIVLVSVTYYVSVQGLF